MPKKYKPKFTLRRNGKKMVTMRLELTLAQDDYEFLSEYLKVVDRSDGCVKQWVNSRLYPYTLSDDASDAVHKKDIDDLDPKYHKLKKLYDKMK